MKNAILILTYFFFVTSCTQYPSGIKDTLQIADKNKKDLEGVLSHYKKDPKDSLKYKAACFLIDNMKWHHSKIAKVPDEFWTLFQLEDSLIVYRNENVNHWKNDRALNGYKYLAKKILVDNAIKNTQIENESTFDSNQITYDFLIHTIDGAFAVKDQPWNKNLSFEDFCEYILPYRFNNEPVFDIRAKLYRHFNRFLVRESLFNDPKKIISAINQYINSFNWDWDEPSKNFPDIGFFNIFYWNITEMACFNHMAIQGPILRSLGIPAIEVFTPKWNDSNSGHSWAGFPTDSKHWILYSPIYQNPGETSKLWSYGRATKFYTKTFKAQEDSPFFLKSSGETIPSVFTSPCIKDITSTIVKTYDIMTKINISDTTINLCYFCTFINGVWDPIGWGRINKSDHSVAFHDIPTGQIGIPCIYKNSQMIPCGNLVELNKKGDVALIFPNENRGTILVQRKFPPKARMLYFTEKIINTKIEGANAPDFSDAVLLSTIKDTLKPYLQDYSFNTNKPFRYYRLVAPEYKLYIAELEFLTSNSNSNTSKATPLTILNPQDTLPKKQFYKRDGKLIGDSVDQNCFDKNLLTFSENSWVGIDLGKQDIINRIRIAPRNANNGIVIGDRYQLFYWNKEWVSVGSKKAKFNFIQFDNVPLNTFYWLRNIDNGREEQPFFYKNGKQIFL